MNGSHVLIAPSVLSADFSRMGEEVEKIEKYGGDWVHLDVMDGRFVPDITFGHKLVEDIRNLTGLPFDVHLMTEKPENQVRSFAEAGADIITFHPEVCVHANRTLDAIKKHDVKAGISLVPSTPAVLLQELLPYVDLILVMTVNPGYGGQKLIPECLHKVSHFRDVRKERGYRYLLAVDGGVNRETAKDVVDAGADVLVVGSAFFLAADPSMEMIALRGGKIV